MTWTQGASSKNRVDRNSELSTDIIMAYTTVVRFIVRDSLLAGRLFFVQVYDLVEIIKQSFGPPPTVLSIWLPGIYPHGKRTIHPS